MSHVFMKRIKCSPPYPLPLFPKIDEADSCRATRLGRRAATASHHVTLSSGRTLSVPLSPPLVDFIDVEITKYLPILILMHGSVYMVVTLYVVDYPIQSFLIWEVFFFHFDRLAA
jgi:hypothetical protein